MIMKKTLSFLLFIFCVFSLQAETIKAEFNLQMQQNSD